MYNETDKINEKLEYLLNNSKFIKMLHHVMLLRVLS